MSRVFEAIKKKWVVENKPAFGRFSEPAIITPDGIRGTKHKVDFSGECRITLYSRPKRLVCSQQQIVSLFKINNYGGDKWTEIDEGNLLVILDKAAKKHGERKFSFEGEWKMLRSYIKHGVSTIH